MEQDRKMMAAASSPAADSDRILARIAQLTKSLRDSMRELGLDQQVAAAAQAVPDARDRLQYVAAKTEEAAHRVLTAIDVAKPVQDRLQADATALESRWAGLNLSITDKGVVALFNDTRAYLSGVSGATSATNAQLLEIMMAQDFQDLTGQVIKKIVDVVSTFELQLLNVLTENIAPERREQFAAQAAALAGESSPDLLMNGPQINPEGKADVVQDQSQVDDLLASLGF